MTDDSSTMQGPSRLTMLEVARSIVTLMFVFLVAACGADSQQIAPETTTPASVSVVEEFFAVSADTADVEAVTVSGDAGSYTFSVTVRSDDTGCGQYSDWWEVLSESGELIYRRVLLHSHVDEQPFNRTGGPVDVQPDETIVVRAHMNTSGYEGIAMKGSAASGFSVVELPSGFGDGVETTEPLPTGCAF